MGRPKVSGGSVAEIAVWTARLTAEEYARRREWFRRLTSPDFNFSALERIARESAWPKPGQVFEMRLDAAPEVDPTKMCDLEFVGRRLSGVVTGRFKLVDIGPRESWNDVESELKRHGALPSGQWQQALSSRFLGAPGYQVGIPDDSWKSSDGWSFFMMITGGGRPTWMTTRNSFPKGWLWVVKVD